MRMGWFVVDSVVSWFVFFFKIIYRDGNVLVLDRD